MPECPACGKTLEHGSFCPYCGREAEPEPRLSLEIQRARFVVHQRCLARFRIRSDRPARLQVRPAIRQIPLEEDTASVPHDRSTRPTEISFAFVPPAAGEYGFDRLEVIAATETSVWAFGLGEPELSIRVSSTEAESSGIVYNIQIREIYGSDINIAGPRPVSQVEWQPIQLALDPGRTRQLRHPVQPREPVASPRSPEPGQLARLILDSLADPRSELAVRRQIVSLAARNLHQPGVIEALVDGMRAARDSETRRELLELLCGLDSSRFEKLEGFHTALMQLAVEGDRSLRARALGRLSTAVNQDARVAPFFLDLLLAPDLSDDELGAALKALLTTPALSESAVLRALTAASRAPAVAQRVAVELAERLPRWSDALVEGLRPYLEDRVDPELRRRLLTRLAQTPSARQEEFARALAELA
jgi:hypothetical protein